MLKDRGLILRSIPLRETSCIISLLCQDHGKVKVVAKGVRTPKSRWAASLQVGNEVEVVFSQKSDRDLGFLKEAMLVHSWVGSLCRLECMGVAMAALELLERVLLPGANEGLLWAQTLDYMARLERINERWRAVQLFYGFESMLLQRLGLYPDLDLCRVCGAPAQGRILLHVVAGTVTCVECFSGQEGDLEISSEVREMLVRSRDERFWLPQSCTKSSDLRRMGLVLHRLLVAHVSTYRYPRSLKLLSNPGSRTVTREGNPSRGGAPGDRHSQSKSLDTAK